MSNVRRYVDQMDRTRMVMPVGAGANGNTLLCRVYFKATGFAGMVEIPRALFTDVPFEKDGRPNLLGRIGFVPVGTKAREDA